MDARWHNARDNATEPYAHGHTPPPVRPPLRPRAQELLSSCGNVVSETAHRPPKSFSSWGPRSTDLGGENRAVEAADHALHARVEAEVAAASLAEPGSDVTPPAAPRETLRLGAVASAVAAAGLTIPAGLAVGVADSHHGAAHLARVPLVQTLRRQGVTGAAASFGRSKEAEGKIGPEWQSSTPHDNDGLVFSTSGAIPPAPKSPLAEL